jgi:hypothetical protein
MTLTLFPGERVVNDSDPFSTFSTHCEGAVQRGRYMTLEAVATVSDNPIVLLSAAPA